MEFRILGPLEVRELDRAIQLGGPRQRAVLAILLTRAGQVTPADVLVDELWGDEPPETAAGVLQNYVSRLRKELGRDVILTRGTGYAVEVARHEFDLRAFERLLELGSEALETGAASEAARLLREGLDLWRGPALGDLADQPFCRLAAGRLEELRLVALERRIEADVASGRDAGLVPELQSLVVSHPLRERLQAQLMRVLYRSGRQAEALESYRSARERLVEELGIEPGRELQELHAAILRQDPGLDGLGPAGRLASEDELPTRAIVVTAADPDRLATLLTVAEPLVRRPARELILASLPADAGALGAASSWLHERADDLAVSGVVARVAAFTSTRPGDDLVRLALEQDVDLLLADAPVELLETGFPDSDLSAVLAGAPCDVALLVSRPERSEAAVLVPFGGVEHDWAAVELGAWIARARGSALVLAGAAAVPEAGKRDASRLLSHASLAVQRGLGVVAEPLLVPPGEAGLLDATAGAGLLVVGLSQRWHREGLGRTRLALVQQSAAPVLLVRRGLRPGGLAPRASLTHYTWSIRI